MNGKFALHDIRDVEMFCCRIIDRTQLELSHHQNEDLLAYLVETAWELSLVYERGDPKYPPRFSVYATNILRRRVVDWSRQRNGRTKWKFADRTYERPRPTIYSLDYRRVVSERLGESNKMGFPDSEKLVDVTPDRSPDLMRILGTRGSAGVGNNNGRGTTPAQEAA